LSKRSYVYASSFTIEYDADGQAAGSVSCIRPVVEMRRKSPVESS
jgi:hypothetical protein